jgi:hypothetical protein
MLNNMIRGASPLAVGGGGGGGPDGTLPTFTTMTALDAGIPTIGRMAQLVGAATGAVILTARRVAEGAGGLEILGPVQLWQASGTEFDGAWAPSAAGTITPAFSWGAPGDVATGGVNLSGGGYLRFPGWQPLNINNISIMARARVLAVPDTPVAGDGVACGYVTPAADRFRGGGLLWTPSAWRCAAFFQTLSVDPTTATVTSALAPTADDIYRLHYNQMNYGATNVAVHGMAYREAADAAGQPPAKPTVGAAIGGGATDAQLAIYARALNARFTHLYAGLSL